MKFILSYFLALFHSLYHHRHHFGLMLLPLLLPLLTLPFPIAATLFSPRHFAELSFNARTMLAQIHRHFLRISQICVLFRQFRSKFFNRKMLL